MPKIKALFLAANPRSTNRLAIDEEMRAIEQKLRAAEYRDALVFQSAWAVRPDDLLQLLNQQQPDIVHFSGHGSSKGLSLAGDVGQDRLVTTRALKALFTTLKDNIRLILLNACYSREQAQTLIEIIDCVIGMKESIGDDAAIAFASSFYRAIGFGRSIREAFDQGVTSLLLEGIAEEDIPELLVKEGVNPNQINLVSGRTPPPTLVPVASTGAIEIFSLYADVEEDKKLLLQLETHFATMQRQGLITTWNKGRIEPGEDERLAMSEHLNRAKIILFMVSSDFMASQYRDSQEVEHALEKRQSGTRVIPIILRSTDWKTSPFGGLMPLPANSKPITKWSDRDEAFLEVVQGIRKVAEGLKTPNP